MRARVILGDSLMTSFVVSEENSSAKRPRARSSLCARARARFLARFSSGLLHAETNGTRQTRKIRVQIHHTTNLQTYSARDSYRLSSPRASSHRHAGKNRHHFDFIRIKTEQSPSPSCRRSLRSPPPRLFFSPAGDILCLFLREEMAGEVIKRARVRV